MSDVRACIPCPRLFLPGFVFLSWISKAQDAQRLDTKLNFSSDLSAASFLFTRGQADHADQERRGYPYVKYSECSLYNNTYILGL